MDATSAERWEIDQDETGNPLVRHRHPPTTVAAYMVKDADGGRQAQCSACGERFELPARQEDR